MTNPKEFVSMQEKVLILILVSLVYSIQLSGQTILEDTRCIMEERKAHLLLNNANYKNAQEARNRQLNDWLENNEGAVGVRETITIPVVIHLVYNNEAENLTDAQLLSQIDVLNEDFGAFNAEIGTVPSQFASSIGDVDLEFCLAEVDPDGNPTDGITRDFTNEEQFSPFQDRIFYDDMGGADAWDSDQYLNIWVCDLGGAVGGFASFPGDAPPEEDGMVIHYANFGRIAVEPPYHLGRTATHEAGHYFNLEHPWSDCGDGDGVEDTPIGSDSYLSQCPSHPQSTCASNDMFMNFMYYTDDACMAMFTEGQKSRILATLDGFRSGLKNSSACNPLTVFDFELEENLKVFPNPIGDIVNIDFNGLNRDHVYLTVYSSQGKRVLFFDDIKNSTLNFSTFSSGIYFLKFESEKGQLVKKVIKH